MAILPQVSPQASKIITTVLLCLVNLVNYMDRYTVSGVLSEIQDDFNIANWQGGLLQTVFVICYFASAPVFGFLGDRYSRKYLMIFGVFGWGACTAISSFMPEYWSFLAFRAAIGFGEAGFTTIAPTVLGDLFDDGKRTIVLACFYFAIPVGSGLGYIIGSTFSTLTGDWRWGVRFTPFLNLLAVILMSIFVVDPPRGETEVTNPNPAPSGDRMAEIKHQLASWGKDLKYLIRNKSYVLSTLAFTSLTFCTGALSWWGPIFVENALKLRDEQNLENEIKVEDVAFLFGIVMCIAGVAGLTLGSGLSFWLRKRLQWIDPVICGCGLFISAPFIFSALATAASDGVVQSFILMFFGQVFLNMNWAIVVDISLYVVVPNRRASAEAFQLMASHALGEAGSPYVCGMIADQIIAHERGSPSHWNSTVPISEVELEYNAFQTALFSSMGFELLSGVFFLLTTFYVVADRKKAEEEEKRIADLAASKQET